MSRATTNPTGSGSVWMRLTLRLTGKGPLTAFCRKYPSREWKKPVRARAWVSASRPPGADPAKSSSRRIEQAASFSRPVSRRAAGLRSTIIWVWGSNRKKASFASRKRLRLISKWRSAGFMSCRRSSVRGFVDEWQVPHGRQSTYLVNRVSAHLFFGFLQQCGRGGAHVLFADGLAGRSCRTPLLVPDLECAGLDFIW